jgi:spoIIIJ-associated protein
MVEEREFEATSEEEAARAAARELGIKEQELEYRIIEKGSKGFLGVGGRPTRIVVVMPVLEEKAERPSIEEEVRGFQEKILDAMQMKLDVEAESKGDYIYLYMKGPDKDLVLQSRAELLEVFQYLLNRIFVKRLDGKRVLADCDGYRSKKEEELKQIAKRVSEKVKQTGVEEELGLMNPYERRIVHLAVSDEEGVSSASRGDGFMKRVTIMPG